MMADVDGVVGAAVAQTGLEDFGDDSFREGLELLLASLRNEARLNAQGEGYIYARIVTALSQRLQVENWYRRHPEMDDVEILPPLKSSINLFPHTVESLRDAVVDRLKR